MKKPLITALAAITTISGALPAGAALAQPAYYGDHDRSRDYQADRNRHPDQWDQNARHWRDQNPGTRFYGSDYGYQGYRGEWRTGQRYPHWQDRRYQISDWRAYNLPPPRPGYAYYRDPNGDVVMAALASGVIGLIIGGALGGQPGYYR